MADSPRHPARADADSLVEYVVEGIIQKVRAGQYVPGQRLVASDLATDFDVSRAPVREALHVLSGEGVVDLIPNRGAVIRRLTIKELLDFMAFTGSICSLGVRRATARMDDEAHRRELEQGYAGIKAAWQQRDADQFINSLYDYHKILNRISGNSFLDFFYGRSYFAFFNRLCADIIPGDNWDEYLAHYEQFHQTVLSGDVPKAVAEFDAHIAWVMKILQEDANPEVRAAAGGR